MIANIGTWINPLLKSGNSTIFAMGTSFPLFVYSITPKLAFYISNSTYILSTNSLEFGAWQQVAIALPVSKDIADVKFFINGQPSAFSKVGTENVVAIGGTSAFGGRSAGTVLFKGSMGNMRIYNRILLDSEVESLFSKQRSKYGV